MSGSSNDKPKNQLQKLQDKIKSGQIKFELSSTETIDKYPHLKDYFIKRIFIDPVLFTDDSKLTDFNLYLEGIRLNILDDFNVDVFPVIHENLGIIFKYIESKPAQSMTADEYAESIGLVRRK